MGRDDRASFGADQWFFAEDQYGFQSWSENTGTCWSSEPKSKRRQEQNHHQCPASVHSHQQDLCDLTLDVVSLHQEAEPVVHVVIVQLTPKGVTEAGWRAKRPVARLLPEEKNKRFHVCAHYGLKPHTGTEHPALTLPGRAGWSRVRAAPAASRPTEETQRRL